MRVEGGQAPILPAGIEIIGRRTHGDGGQHGVLFTPGVGAMTVDTNGEVGVKPDRHAEPVRFRRAVAELAIGNPLNEFVEFAICLVRAAKCIKLRTRRSAPGPRPFGPWPRSLLSP